MKKRIKYRTSLSLVTRSNCTAQLLIAPTLRKILEKAKRTMLHIRSFYVKQAHKFPTFVPAAVSGFYFLPTRL